MFILGDDTHDRGRIPWVTFTLIGLNFLVGCAQLRFGERLTNGYALVPKEITEIKDITTKQPIKVPGHNDFWIDEDGDIHVIGASKVHYIPHYSGPFPIVLTLFTYMFLHGDVFHLLFNLWFLFIFGRNVECALDHGKYLGFYLFCGVVAGVAQMGADYHSVIPIVGASGAIAGVMGAYMAIFPWNNMKILLGGIGLMFGVVEVPAFIVVGIWFVGQFMIGMATMNIDVGGGTAYWCHIGGFVAGFATVKVWAYYLTYQVRQLEAEREAERRAANPDEPPPPADALVAPDEPTPEQFDNLLDPVDTFKRARNKVFRDVPENDPFDRPCGQPLVAELVEEAPPEATHGIVANLPKPRKTAATQTGGKKDTSYKPMGMEL
jgi:membrane associated rhomboid family serine protease